MNDDPLKIAAERMEHARLGLLACQLRNAANRTAAELLQMSVDYANAEAEYMAAQVLYDEAVRAAAYARAAVIRAQATP